MKKRPVSRKAASKKKASARKPVRKVSPIPEGYHVVTPYLAIRGAANAIEFYKKAFGARERMRMAMPGGGIGHAEIKIGDSIVMLADEFADMDFLGPQSHGGTSVTMHLYVRDCDKVFQAALAAGGKVKRPLKDEFYGDRSGCIEDPFGHLWNISTHKEELTMAQIRKRMAAMGEGGHGS